MLWQSTLILKPRILDCFDFLQKSRNNGVGGIVIAIRLAYYAVIARFGKAESWQSKQTLKIKYARSVNLRPLSVILSVAKYPYKSFCFIWLSQKVESLYPIDSNPQSEIPLIRSWLIYFTHCVKSFALDTSLRINATLSMTKRFGLLRRIYDSPRNDGVGADCHTLTSSSLAMTIQHRFAQFIRFATSHTTFKGIKMQT